MSPRMNSPVHQFLVDTIGVERLQSACLVEDHARTQTPQPRRRPAPGGVSFCHDLCSVQSRSTVSLHSLPSLTSESVVSRWDSCIKKTTDCLSPPQRRPRKLGEKLSIDVSPSMPRVRMLSTPVNPFESPSCSNFHKPTLPIRKASFNGLPSLPRWDDSDQSKSSSPNSVRAGLDEILGHALKECADLSEDCYADNMSEDFSTMAVQ